MAVGGGIGIGNAGHRGVGEHDAEPERVVGAVALDDPDLVPRVGLLHQQREIERTGTAADADDVQRPGHTGAPSFSSDPPMIRR